MEVVFEGRMHVSYSQAYLDAADHPDDYDGAFAGQVNGLLGASLPGHLTLFVGVHTGSVGLRVVLCEQAPDVGEEWEDVVEASFAPEWPDAHLAGCLADTLCTFELSRPSYRVRWSARGIDAGRAADVVFEHEPLLDHYELAFWPAPPAADAILREGSDDAKYRHRMQDPAVARAARTAALWGDVPPPGDALLDLWCAPWLVELDRDLAETLAAADPGVQRAVAYWAAGQACTQTGLDAVAWVASALDELQENRLLPALFHDPDALYAQLDSDAPDPAGGPSATNGWPTTARGYALSTLVQAAGTDPLVAVISALKEAHEVRGEAGSSAFLAEVRAALTRIDTELTADHGGPVPDLRPPFAEPDPLADVPDGMDPGEYFRQRDLWGGELPSARLVEVWAWSLGSLDRVLTESLAAASETTQRAVAVWAARRACEGAGLTVLPQVVAALDALESGAPLPAPFDQEGGEWVLLERGDLSSGAGTITYDGTPNCSRAHFALPSVREAADVDPLRAATQTLWTAVCSFGDDRRLAVLAEAAGRFRLSSSISE